MAFLSVELTPNRLKKTPCTVHRQQSLPFRLSADLAYTEGFTKSEKALSGSKRQFDRPRGRVGSCKELSLHLFGFSFSTSPIYKRTIFLISSSPI